ncbi:MAG: exo-alpha-sialidase [Armatimonadetes bacterium]|nr:exo-alpha-sialidase [Armatimonadota bacterium]
MNNEATEAQVEAPFLGDQPGDVQRLEMKVPYGVPLALPDGRILLWGVSGEERRQQAIASFSKDNGHTWTEPKPLFSFPQDRGIFTSGAALVSHQGTIHLFGLDYYGFDFDHREKSKSYLWHARSRDGGKTWEPVQKVDFGLEYTGASNNAFQLRSGRIIAPVSGLSRRRISPWVSLAPYSDDDGATWHKPRQLIPVPTGAADWYESGAAEPVGVELRDGRVWLLPRSQDGYQWESFSRDGGLRWSPARHTRFISNQSAMAVMRLRDGRLLLIWNNCGAEGLGEVNWGNAERAVLTAAVSPDEGKTWKGYREVGRAVTDAQVSYPYITQARDGSVLLSAGGSLVRLEPDFLARTQMTEDFSRGLRRWSTLAAPGTKAASDPDGAFRQALLLLKPSTGRPSGACLSFPYGRTGEIALSLRTTPGFQGAHFTLTDHYDLPGLEREGSFPFRALPSGRIQIIGSGGSWLDTPGDLLPEKRHELRLKWNCARGQAVLRLDGTEIARIEQHVRAPGVCYLRLRSTARETDPHGLYLASVRIKVTP